VQALNELMQGHAILHLDANQSWDLAGGIKFNNEVGCAAIDYIEEPFKNHENIPEFYMKTTIPVAVDESLTHLNVKEVSAIDGVDVFILKPTILGGIEKTWRMMQHAKKFAIKAIISSSFESSIGILALANLAGATSRDNWAGVDTLKWFQEDVLTEKIPVKRGRIDISSQFIQNKNINYNVLTKIDS